MNKKRFFRAKKGEVVELNGSYAKFDDPPKDPEMGTYRTLAFLDDSSTKIVTECKRVRPVDPI